jgi:hypothetical protein
MLHCIYEILQTKSDVDSRRQIYSKPSNKSQNFKELTCVIKWRKQKANNSIKQYPANSLYEKHYDKFRLYMKLKSECTNTASFAHIILLMYAS